MQKRFSCLVAAFAILFLDSFSYAVLFPIFPSLFFSSSIGILSNITTEWGRNFILGLIMIAYPFAQFWGAPFFGSLADRHGRKKILTWTLIGTCFGYIMTAVGIITKLYSVILISRLLTGFFGANLALCLTIIADSYEHKKQRGKAISLAAVFLGISWILAIAVGSLLSLPQQLMKISPSLPFWGAVLIFFVSLFILKKFYRETWIPEKKDHIPKLLHGIVHVLDHKQLRVLYLTLFFWFIGFFISLQWLAPLSIDKLHASATDIKWLYVLLGVFWALGSGLINRWLIEHSSLWKISLWSLFLISLFFFFSGSTDFFFYLAASYVLASLFVAIAWGNIMSLISLASSPENQGKSLGIGQSMLSLAEIIGPIFGGIVAGFSVELIFFIAPLLVFISFLFLLVYVIRRKHGLLI